MFRFVRNLLVSLFLAATVAAAITFYYSPDPMYTAQELVMFRRYSEFDDVIRQTAKEHGVDPMLVKAVVWRETRFRSEMAGNDGERGLMQVTEGAAQDWVDAEGIEGFRPTDLFDPRTNLQVGTWYLARALDRWSEKDDPVPFALAEYNAGRTRVNKWISESNMGDKATAYDLKEHVAFPSTQKYIETIEDRYKFYKDRDRM